MKAIGLYVFVEHINEEIKTGEGLLLTAKDASDMRYHKAKVISVGDEVPANKLERDDIILYDKRQGFSLMLDGIQITVISLRDVVGVF